MKELTKAELWQVVVRKNELIAKLKQENELLRRHIETLQRLHSLESRKSAGKSLSRSHLNK